MKDTCEYILCRGCGGILCSTRFTETCKLLLFEKCRFHTEDAKQTYSQRRLPPEIDPAPLIIMMTSERMLLLDGELDQNFCSVVWESMIDLIVHVEVLSPVSFAPELDNVVIWYLSSGLRFAKPTTSDAKKGTDSLQSKSFFVPRETGLSLLNILNEKINSI